MNDSSNPYIRNLLTADPIRKSVLHQCIQSLHHSPLLEASLHATCSAYIPYIQNTPPEVHFSRIPYWFQQAGLVNITPRTFVADYTLFQGFVP